VQAHLAALANGETPPPATSEPTWPRSSQAYRAPGMPARSVRRSPSRPNHGICGAYKKSRLRSSSRVPPRRPRRRPHQLLSRHPRKCTRSRSRFTPSLVMPVSRRSAWRGRLYAADWRNSLPSTPCSSSKNCAFSFQAGLPASSTKRSSDGSVAGARRLAHVASSSAPRRIVGSATNRVADVPIFLGNIGKRSLDALKSSRIKPPSSFSSSSRLVTRDNTARGSFTHCRGEYGRGASKPCSGRSAALPPTPLRAPHVWPPVTFLVRQPVTELR
jgi:hypothetical protein